MQFLPVQYYPPARFLPINKANSDWKRTSSNSRQRNEHTEDTPLALSASLSSEKAPTQNQMNKR